MTDPFEENLQELLKTDPRYKKNAYYFIREVLYFASKTPIRHLAQTPHLNEKDVCNGVLELSLNRFGPLAQSCLSEWGITTTLDIGNIIFNLINNGSFTASPGDDIENFKDLYDFDSAFNSPFINKHNANLTLPQIDLM